MQNPHNHRPHDQPEHTRRRCIHNPLDQPADPRHRVPYRDGGLVEWLVNAAASGVFGLVVGAMVVGVLHLVKGRWKKQPDVPGHNA